MATRIYKEENMAYNISAVLTNIGASLTSILATLYGKLIVLLVFVGAYFASIAGMVHIMIALVLVDAFFGIAVTVKKKGVGYIVSSKLRSTLYKMFFYLIFLVFTFLVEFQITGVDCVTPKLIFALIAGVELWSIAANALILTPNFPFLRIFKKYLASEISKKLSISPEEVKELLDNTPKDDTEGTSDEDIYV